MNVDSTNVYIDTHCHFNFEVFKNDWESIWGKCQSLGIQSLFIAGVDPFDFESIQRIVDCSDGIYFSAGLHPWWIDKRYVDFFNQHEFPENVLVQLSERILDLTAHPKCVAIGECGLDKKIKAPLLMQKQVFELQLSLAQNTELPVIVHNGAAHVEILDLLETHKLSRGGVIHAFSGSTELGLRFIQHGFLLGVGGVITYDRAKKTRRALSGLPLESLVLETDSPDMPLSGRQGQRNTPESIVDIALCLARLRSQSVNQIAKITSGNAKAMFSIE